jgi:hypothetical protein
VEGNTVTGVADYHGIWSYAADDGVIRLNTVTGTLVPAGKTADGNGIGIDEDSNNVIVERNLTYNNTGAGYIISAFHAAGNGNNGSIFNPIIRNNISINDCAGAVMVVSVQLVTNGAPAVISNALVDNNTIYQSRAGKYCAGPTDTQITGRVANNIFYTGGAATGAITTFSSINPSNVLYTGNCYFGTATVIRWNGVNYAGPAAWRAAFATQETLAGSPAYLTADPLLVNPGTTVAADYKLQGASPMKGVGLNLFTQFSLANPTTDYFGAPLPNAVGTGYNVGADGNV